MRRGRARGVLLVAPLALAACWVPIERGRQMEDRIQRLEVASAEQQRTLEEQREVVRERVARMDQKIQEVQTKIDELNHAARRSGADLGVALTRLQDEFARVKGELEVAHHKLDELEKAIGDLGTKTEGRFAALKGAGALDEYEARQKVASLQRPDDKAAFFALADKEDKDGDKGIARELFEEYARKWPTDPRAAEARFRAGDIYFAQKRWREALLSYGKVAEDFPRSSQAPGAMLAAAESMLKLDMKDEAKAVLEQLVGKYPKDRAAARAKDRLAELFPSSAPAKRKKRSPRKN